ncbi:Hypothetical protein CINCED_3A021690 [Cinara cedri]|uniref:BRCT domain-containing protein n=1 Tax=Cinara cedri TaxID=506608 RepID=A0A5E4NJV6_9HEMI|nr:Hypothetical protein CINCED_3A021690 [Cinara cedri]
MYMGGIFSYHLRENTTHLMVGKVGSKKYIKAVETGITVMIDSWVDAVWEESLSHINIVKEKFDKFKCPPFYKLIMTTSGLDVFDQEEVITLIFSFGGMYTPQMIKRETHVLIISNPKGQKFTYAQQWGLMCLKPSWIYDSVEKGYMVDTNEYIVKNELLCSTLASGVQVRPNFSQADISEITAEPKSSIEDTINNCTNFPQADIREITAEPKSSIEDAINNCSELKCQQINNCVSQDSFTTPKKNNLKNINYKSMLECIGLSEVKKAGTILDGCKVYFSGFSLSEEEKLKRIVISTGGIRYTELNESITHILVGEFSSSLVKLLHSIREKPHVVNFSWLVESINLKCTAPEEQFLAMDSSHLFSSESPSPLSKKGLYMMKDAKFSQPNIVDKPKPTISAIMENHPSDNFINQYLNVENTNLNGPQSQKSSYTNTTEDTVSTQDSRFESILEGLTILLYDLDVHQLPSIKSKIISMGGVAVNTRSYQNKIDYVVVPIVFDEKSLNIKATIVSCLWVEDCYNNIEKVSVEYYHKPVIFSGSTPLKNCVITVTNYAGSERYFLKEVSLLLGAHYQDAMSRKQKLENNIMATTHLICSAPEGSKYQAAVKWSVPVVSKEWLIKCVTCKCRLPEEHFQIVNISTTIKSTSMVSPTTSTPRNISRICKDSNTSFTQKLTVPAMQENCTESELAVPLKDTDDEIKPPLKKKCSMEMINPTSQLLEPVNKTPVLASQQSSPSTPLASKSFMDNLSNPRSPYGQIFYDKLVPDETKKKWRNWINTLPDGPDEDCISNLKRRNSTVSLFD